MKKQKKIKTSGEIFNFIVFTDVCLGLLVIFIAIFFIAFSQMAKTIEELQKGYKDKAEYYITMDWNDKSQEDIDLWVETPTGDIVFFREREKGLVGLARDDRGTYNDLDAEGNPVLLNREIISIRGIVPGEYIVNVHAYSDLGKPEVINVELLKINPYTLILKKEVTLQEKGSEITVFRFTMNSTGGIENVGDLPKSLVSEKTIQPVAPVTPE